MSDISQYDCLDSEVKRLFRENEIEFYYPLWFQCKMLAKEDKQAFEMFKNTWIKNVKLDQSTLVLPNFWR